MPRRAQEEKQEKQEKQEEKMLQEIRAALERSRETIWQDIVGAVALLVLLLGALYLPGLAGLS